MLGIQKRMDAMNTKEKKRTITVQVKSSALVKLKIAGIEEDKHIGTIVGEGLELWWDAKGYKAKKGPLNEGPPATAAEVSADDAS